MSVIGVAGGIASGKTTVCKLFEKWGARIIDGDLIGKEVVDKDPALLEELIRAFGESILHQDGSLDRRRLGKIVFQDPLTRQRLNRIVHPALLAELAERVKQCQRENPKTMIVVDAALLLEWDLRPLLDRLIVVVAAEEKRMERLIRSVGLTPKEARDRIKAQSVLEAKTRSADYTITNNGSLQELEHQARAVWERIGKNLKSKIEPTNGYSQR
ncbi:MAG: dephospho-CoA kinase [bacterium]